jgi:hypothetical protein
MSILAQAAVRSQEFLENAGREARARGLYDFPIVDVDAHHYEILSWRDII